ncbi:tetratricopeptide repeat protein [Sulfitobacter sp.]|uniref:tetratricopeptide repeat protein n=1 Tax=Sulfitobacter sp. TaxID=1903071 RepID=UPI00329A4EB9
MPFASSIVKYTAIGLLCGTLAACKSAEEQAEEYYQSALGLIAEGDADRALVELRNVFQLDQNHREARVTIARMMLEQNNIQSAYSNYLYLAERFPDDQEARIVLSELAFEVRNWDELERHGKVAMELAPDEPRVKAIALGRSYRSAAQDSDQPALEGLSTQAEALIVDMPNNHILSEILIDTYTRGGRYEAALAQIDQRIANEPDSRQLYERRIGYLTQMGDISAVEDQLRDMVDRFPDVIEAKAQLIQFYISRQQLDQAETFLREISDPAAEDPGFFLDLVRFVGEVRGTDAARTEIERAIEANPKPERFIAMRAMLDFGAGQQDEAVSALEAIIAQDLPEDDPEALSARNDIRIMLARMLTSQGNEVGARRQVETVLSADTGHADALKMQAAWHIQADNTDGAIANLRLALDSEPEDVQAMNLMAEAYTRSGSHDLARDFLALAVDASNNAPEPALRYARMLASEERYRAAEDVLLPALRQQPRNIELLSALGQIYIPMEDLGRARQVVDTLRRLETDEGNRAADGLEATLLNATQGTEQALAFLEQVAQSGDADLDDKMMLVRARLSVGETDAALALADEMAAENPDNDLLRFALAIVRTVAGDLDTAITEYKALLNDDNTRGRVWLELSRALARQGDRDGSVKAIEDGLAIQPEDCALLWAQASILEQNGDVDGAIVIYETLYERNSNAVVIANNLASLLSTYKEDPESLDRAWAIARRLRGAENPALQDTYGWIAFRRGDSEDALPYLEAAAKGLPGDPLVQAHLGFVLAKMERAEEALTQLQKAVELAGPADTRVQIEQAREEISRLRTASQQN